MNVTILSVLLAIASPVVAAEPFKDVPKDHWAAESVKVLADAGVVKGYPDGAFKGNKPVTRYELAVALDGMIRFIQASFQPVKTIPDAKPARAGKRDSVDFLKKNGFLPADSPILVDGSKPVSGEELAQALAAVAAKLIEQRVPAASPASAD